MADLGSNESTVRESASEELARIGSAAVAALEAAARHPDPEVRYRSQRVLGLIRRSDLERRLEAFLSGKEGADKSPLPGWARFRKRYGDDAPARALFVEVQRADPDLMKALEEGPRRAAEMLGLRTVQQQQALQMGVAQISMGQIAAILVVAAEEDVLLAPPLLSGLYTLCYQQSFRDVLNSSTRRDLPRKMLGSIIRRSEDLAAYPAMGVANQYDLPEGIVPAQRILSSPGGNTWGPLAQSALMTVARLGDSSHLPLVEKLLNDTTHVTQFQENATVYDVQVRDVALAAAVLLSKQDLRAYFDIPVNQQLADPRVIFFNARYIGFPDNKKRAAVFDKWAKFKASQVRQQAPDKS